MLVDCHLSDVHQDHGSNESIADSLFHISSRFHYHKSAMTNDDDTRSNHLANTLTTGRDDFADDNVLSSTEDHAEGCHDHASQPRREKEHRGDHGCCVDVWHLERTSVVLCQISRMGSYSHP